MPYNPSQQHPRSGASRPQQPGGSHEFAGYDAPPYESSAPSARAAREAWRDNRDYREDEGYREPEDYRRYPDYRFGDDERANPNYRPDRDYGFGQSYRARSDWEQSGREPWGARPAHAAQEEWSQPQYGYRSAQFRGRRQASQLLPGGEGGGYGMPYPGARQRDFGGQEFQPDELAYRARQSDFRGRAPKGYVRADERIREDVCECLTQDPRVDAGEVTVTVKAGVVTLEGAVDDRHQKYCAEEIADRVSGVQDVQNRLNVARAGTATTGVPGGEPGEFSKGGASHPTRQ